MTKPRIITPEPNESVKSWTERYKRLMGKDVTRKVMLAFTDRFPMVDIKEEADVKGLGLSEKIQRGLTLCKELFPDERDYIWLGTMQFWFSSASDAVTFKLNWSHNNS